MSKATGKAKQKSRKKGRPTQKKTPWLAPVLEAVRECRVAIGGCAFSPKLIELMAIEEDLRAAAERKNGK